MTVSDLITKLQAMPQDAVVCYMSGVGGRYQSIEHVGQCATVSIGYGEFLSKPRPLLSYLDSATIVKVS